VHGRYMCGDDMKLFCYYEYILCELLFSKYEPTITSTLSFSFMPPPFILLSTIPYLEKIGIS